MSDSSTAPTSVEELKQLIEEWIGYDTGDLKEGEVPAEITEQYGEDPLAGVDHDTYMKALTELHTEGVIDDSTYEQAQEQLEVNDDYSPEGLLNNLTLNITNVDNSIHTGDDFHGSIEQGDTTTVSNSGSGIAAGGDVYDSPVVTGDEANVATGEGDAGDGDDISADGSNIYAEDGSAVNFGEGSAEGSNTETYDDHSTYEDNDPVTDNSTWDDHSTYTDNDPYTYEDNDDIDTTVETHVEAEGEYEHDHGGYKPDEHSHYDGDDIDTNVDVEVDDSDFDYGD
jgi:hypothetical protein